MQVDLVDGNRRPKEIAEGFPQGAMPVLAQRRVDVEELHSELWHAPAKNRRGEADLGGIPPCSLAGSEHHTRPAESLGSAPSRPPRLVCAVGFLAQGHCDGAKNDYGTIILLECSHSASVSLHRHGVHEYVTVFGLQMPDNSVGRREEEPSGQVGFVTASRGRGL